MCDAKCKEMCHEIVIHEEEGGIAELFVLVGVGIEGISQWSRSC